MYESNIEAEYKALKTATSELLWIFYLLRHISIPCIVLCGLKYISTIGHNSACYKSNHSFKDNIYWGLKRSFVLLILTVFNSTCWYHTFLFLNFSSFWSKLMWASPPSAWEVKLKDFYTIIIFLIHVFLFFYQSITDDIIISTK